MDNHVVAVDRGLCVINNHHKCLRFLVSVWHHYILPGIKSCWSLTSANTRQLQSPRDNGRRNKLSCSPSRSESRTYGKRRKQRWQWRKLGWKSNRRKLAPAFWWKFRGRHSEIVGASLLQWKYMEVYKKCCENSPRLHGGKKYGCELRELG